MIRLCVAHDMLSFDEGKTWKCPKRYDSHDIAHRLRKPVCINPACPRCQEVDRRRKNFLSGLRSNV